MGGKERPLVLQDVAAGTGSEHEDDTESEGEGHQSLLRKNGKLPVVTEDVEKVPVTERIRTSTVETFKYIGENKRKLAAVVVLWMSFLMALMAVSLLAPFFPQEVSSISLAMHLTMSPPLPEEE